MATDLLGLVPLSALSAAGPSEVGGKGYQTGRLHDAGLPVPETMVVPVSVFTDFLWQSGLMPLAEVVERSPSRAPEIEAALRAATLPPALIERWTQAARALGPKISVRSSGVDEDGARRSFAGQHETSLGVPPEAVPDAIRSCWASLYRASALAYRGERGPKPGSLAVLLQPQLEPRCAGVMFTINPTNGSWHEMVVEAVLGQGEGLVSGQIAPQWYLVRRPGLLAEHGLTRALRDRLPKTRSIALLERWIPRRRLDRSSSALARIAERVQVELVEQALPEQTERLVAARSGLVREPVPEVLRRAPILDPATLKRLCRLGLRIERSMGAPQDIEWAQEESGALRILQARAVTARGAVRETGVLWTRRFVGERFPEPVTPLGWSLLQPILEWLVAYPETQAELLGGGPALKLVSGRPYVNATVFRHLAFKLPGSPPPRFMLELVPPDEEETWRRSFAVAPDLEVYRSIFRTTLRERRWERFYFNPFTNHLHWARFQDELEAELPSLAPPGPDSDPKGVVALVERHLAWVRRYVSIHVCSLLFANISWQLLEACLASWLPDRKAELMEGLAACPPGNLTVQTNTALHAMSQLATDADLAALSARDLAALSPPFGAALASFLAQFGHRSEASWEIMSPRWRSHPERIAPLVAAQRASPESASARADRSEARYQEAVSLLRRRLSGARLTLAEIVVQYTRRYLLLRENQRFWFDHLLYSLQRSLLWLGARLVERGALQQEADAAWLTWEELSGEILGASAGRGQDLRALVAARKAAHDTHRSEHPPTFLRDDRSLALLDSSPHTPQGGTPRIDGLAISPGRVRARARVIRTLAEGHRLQRGDILVTRAIDPGWTPLFHNASGLVLEMGSVLSHGAVVAREYGLPAVVNIERATERIADGQEITVDGTRGAVWVHGAPY